MEYKGTDICFLNLDSEWSYALNFTTQRFAPKCKSLFYFRAGGSLGPKIGLEAVGRQKCLAVLGVDPRSVDSPTTD
jgi:hypothetical protein